MADLLSMHILPLIIIWSLIGALKTSKKFLTIFSTSALEGMCASLLSSRGNHAACRACSAKDNKLSFLFIWKKYWKHSRSLKSLINLQTTLSDQGAVPVGHLVCHKITLGKSMLGGSIRDHFSGQDFSWYYLYHYGYKNDVEPLPTLPHSPSTNACISKLCHMHNIMWATFFDCHNDRINTPDPLSDSDDTVNSWLSESIVLFPVFNHNNIIITCSARCQTHYATNIQVYVIFWSMTFWQSITPELQ